MDQGSRNVDRGREPKRKNQKGTRRGQIVEAIKKLKGAGIKALKDEEWGVENGIVLKEGRIYMLEGDLRREIIQLYHDTPLGGHGGRWKMTELISRNYWWPGVTKEVGRYVEGCDAYQRYKN